MSGQPITYLEGVPVYEKIEDIPYPDLEVGGDFWVYTVPPAMEPPGFGQAVVATDPGAMQGLLPAWILALIAFKALLLKTICVVVVTVVIGVIAGHVVYRIKAIPKGEVIDVLPDQTRVFQAADGSTWLLFPNGESEKIGDPPATLTTNIVVIAIAIIAVIVFVVVVPRLVKKKD